MRRRTSFALAILAALVGWGLAGEHLRSRDMQSEIDRLEARAAEMERKNARLEETADDVSAREMLEREARLKMNLQKPGEQVVVINGIGQSAPSVALAAPVDDDGNPALWWRYFFR